LHSTTYPLNPNSPVSAVLTASHTPQYKYTTKQLMYSDVGAGRKGPLRIDAGKLGLFKVQFKPTRNKH
jgi:hypothetical protein